MTTRWVEVAPGVSVKTDTAEGESERNARLYIEAENSRRRAVREAMLAGPFPATLTQWARRVDRSEDIRDGGQIVFFRDVLMRAVCDCIDDARAYRPQNDGDPGVTSGCMVIATHASKGCVLPVVRIQPRGLRFVAWVRGNFHNFMVSVETTDGSEVSMDHGVLFNPGSAHPAVYCEGFPEEVVFGSYTSNRARFTVRISTAHEVFTFFYLLSRWSRTHAARAR